MILMKEQLGECDFQNRHEITSVDFLEPQKQFTCSYTAVVQRGASSLKTVVWLCWLQRVLVLTELMFIGDS